MLCLNRLRSAQTTGSITKACRSKHWFSENEVSAQRSFGRAAVFLQKFWYILQENAYQIPLVKVENKKNELLLYEGDRWKTPRARRSGSCWEFNNQIFKHERDKEAALSVLGCTETMIYLHQTSAWLLKGMYRNIEEMHFSVKGVIRETKLVDQYGGIDTQGYRHQIWRVTLNNGEKYALDITGAQYGWHEPATPWTEYSHSRRSIIQTFLRVARPVEFFGHEYLTMFNGRYTNDVWEPPLDDPACVSIRRLVTCLDSNMELAFSTAQPGSNGFLELEESAYEKEAARKLELAEEVVQKVLEQVDRDWPAEPEEQSVFPRPRA